MLGAPATAEQWRAYHDIRRVELFEARGRFGVYDEAHPDERAPTNHSLLLWVTGGRPVGTARLDDFGDGTGAVRLVAVTSTEQGKGHGRKLMTMLEGIALHLGIHTLYINSAPTAVGFYEKIGWSRYVWSEQELAGIAADCVQMQKEI
jgi:GNAT superfamily N-acetyltransferase